MISVSLVPYVSNHDLDKVSVDGLAYHDFCLQFKAGHAWATRKAAMMVGNGLKRNSMKNVVFLCVPASTKRKNTRRYQRFSSMVCNICGAENGFTYLWRDSDYKAEHLSPHHYNQQARASRLLMDEDKIAGKDVVLFDDVCSSGRTMQAAVSEIQKHGGRVAIAITLGRTVHRAWGTMAVEITWANTKAMTVPEIIPDPEYGKCDEESLAVDKEWHGHSLHQ